MALGDFNIEVQFRYTYLDQKCMNRQHYSFESAVVGGITMVHILEALWNHYKTPWRAVTPAAGTQIHFDAVFGREVVSAGEYAEFPIPPAEQVGTKSVASLLPVEPSFTTVNIRQSVGTQATRPGQKRFNGLVETEIEANALTTAAKTLYGTLANLFQGGFTLGAPAATVDMMHVIAQSNGTQFPTVFQPVVGIVMNPNVGTQVSRKIGRGR